MCDDLYIIHLNNRSSILWKFFFFFFSVYIQADFWMIIFLVELFTKYVVFIMLYLLHLKKVIPFILHLSCWNRHSPWIHLKLGWKCVAIELEYLLECPFPYFPCWGCWSWLDWPPIIWVGILTSGSCGKVCQDIFTIYWCHVADIPYLQMYSACKKRISSPVFCFNLHISFTIYLSFFLWSFTEKYSLVRIFIL